MDDDLHFESDRDVAMAWAISDAFTEPPPGLVTIRLVVAGLETRGFRIVRDGDPVPLDEQVAREFRR